MKQYQVWNFINEPGLLYYKVESPEEAVKLIDRLTNVQLKHDWIITNAFGLEVFENGEWWEWESEDGYDINEYGWILEGR